MTHKEPKPGTPEYMVFIVRQCKIMLRAFHDLDWVQTGEKTIVATYEHIEKAKDAYRELTGKEMPTVNLDA